MSLHDILSIWTNLCSKGLLIKWKAMQNDWCYNCHNRRKANSYRTNTISISWMKTKADIKHGRLWLSFWSLLSWILKKSALHMDAISINFLPQEMLLTYTKTWNWMNTKPKPNCYLVRRQIVCCQLFTKICWIRCGENKGKFSLASARISNVL